LSPNALAALPWMFEVWAHPEHQLPPPGPWSTWVILGGRGAGKTRAGAEWIRREVEGATPLSGGQARRVALLAETWEQAREVMVLGESGLMAISPPDRRPQFHATRRALIWPNGAEARLFSASDPESLRGPQFDRAWSDELAKWRLAQQAWDMLQFCLRLGEAPRQMVTTTPRDAPALRAILGGRGVVVTRAATDANRRHLPASFFDTITAKFRGTARGREELDGELLEERAGALFTRAMMERARVQAAPELERVVVAVDPPVTGGPRADECGIVVAGLAGDRVFVLADESLRAAPTAWAERVVGAWREHHAARIVAEANQGGDLVIELIRSFDPAAPVTKVIARHGKAARAEPVSLLYERGLVRHVGQFPELEDQMCVFGHDTRSPDRVDALVWAVTELTRRPAQSARVRRL
jgi:phage terminase large subunit-like protein